jgi:hypothetical protein
MEASLNNMKSRVLVPAPLRRTLLSDTLGMEQRPLHQHALQNRHCRSNLDYPVIECHCGRKTKIFETPVASYIYRTERLLLS